jgi:hypothetical protein
MPHVIKMGTVPEKGPPWWEDLHIRCGVCDSVFILDMSDFEDGAWKERQQAFNPGGPSLVGVCPVCDSPMLIFEDVAEAPPAEEEEDEAEANDDPP